MQWLGEIWRRLLFLFRRRQFDRDLEEEMQFHLDMKARQNLEAGLAGPEARYAARRQFGNATYLKERSSEMWTWGSLETVAQDVKYALRQLRRTPGFTAVAALSLALGIGANTAIFSLLDQILVRPLPVRHPEEIVMFRSFGPNPGMDRNSGRKASFSYPKYVEFRDKAQSFSGVIARYGEGATLTCGGQADRIDIELVSGNYFDVLGVGAAAGRVLTPEDDKTWRAEPYVVLSYEYWQRRFGGDRSIVGKAVQINDTMMTVIGVSAKGFHGIERGSSYDARVPMMMKSFITPMWPRINERFWAWLNIIARLKPGVTREQAEAESNVLYHQLLEGEAPLLQGAWTRQKDEFVHRKLDLLPAVRGITWNVDRMSGAIVALMAMVGVVLLIACVNVASLLMARAVARQREVAIRVALGAGRMRVARQFVIESLLLASIGGALGLLFALAVGRPAVALLLDSDALKIYSIAPEWRLLAFTMAVSLSAALLFGGAAPAQLARAPLNETLKNESNASAGGRSVRLRKALVILQVAFCVVLMIGAGLFARTLHNLRNLDLGFEKRNLITFSIDASLAGYGQKRTEQAYRQIEEKLAAIPGVESAAASSYGVLKGGVNINRYNIEGFRPEHPEDTEVREIAATPGYLRSLGLRLISGRPFQEAEYGTGRATIVNRSFAKRFFNGADPVGRTLRPGFGDGLPMQIVGMIGDEKYMAVREDPQPSVYVPILWFGSATFYVRTHHQVSAVIQEIRRIIQMQAPAAPLYDLRTMEEQVESRLRVERMVATLATCFGALAMALGAVGLYGVISYVVATRTREIGVRLALGSGRPRVFAMVLRDVAALVMPGLILGLAAGIMAARYIRSDLYGVQAADPATIAAAMAVCTCVGALAGLIPALRATRVDPVRALRWE